MQLSVFSTSLLRSFLTSPVFCNPCLHVVRLLWVSLCQVVVSVSFTSVVLYYLFGSFIRFFLLEQNSCFFVTAHAYAVTSWGSLSYFVSSLTSLDVVLWSPADPSLLSPQVPVPEWYVGFSPTVENDGASRTWMVHSQSCDVSYPPTPQTGSSARTRSYASPSGTSTFWTIYWLSKTSARPHRARLWGWRKTDCRGRRHLTPPARVHQRETLMGWWGSRGSSSTSRYSWAGWAEISWDCFITPDVKAPAVWGQTDAHVLQFCCEDLFVVSQLIQAQTQRCKQGTLTRQKPSSFTSFLSDNASTLFLTGFRKSQKWYTTLHAADRWIIDLHE